MNFRRVYKGENLSGIFRLSPTDLGKCPLVVYDKKTGKKDEYPIAEDIEEIFQSGNKAHIVEGFNREGARSFINKELHMTIIDNNRVVVFSGYADFIMMDGNGLYIEDLKTCDRKAFYFFFTNPNEYGEKIQISGYNLLYYVIFGVLVDRGVITKIDRDNFLNRISLQYELFSPAATELIILNHPALLYYHKKISESEFLKQTYEHVKNYSRWLCSYCAKSRTCLINKKLTLEEEKAKIEKKKKKATFKKLLE